MQAYLWHHRRILTTPYFSLKIKQDAQRRGNPFPFPRSRRGWTRWISREDKMEWLGSITSSSPFGKQIFSESL
jgi:hypothetical protein